MDDERNLNLNGEFLGVTSLAVYSAPWFLQPPLILIVGLMFLVKVAQGSRSYREQFAHLDDDSDEYERMANEVNRLFFGFTVERRSLPVYWLGGTIFIVTLVHAFYGLALELLPR